MFFLHVKHFLSPLLCDTKNPFIAGIHAAAASGIGSPGAAREPPRGGRGGGPGGGGRPRPGGEALQRAAAVEGERRREAAGNAAGTQGPLLPG